MPKGQPGSGRAGRGRGGRGRGRGAPPHDAGSSSEAVVVSAASVGCQENASHYAKIKTMLAELCNSCDVFGDIANAAPIARDGMAAYSDAGFDKEMKDNASGKYRALCNMMWLSFDETEGPNKGVPIVNKSIISLQKHYFQKPRAMPLPVVVALRTGQTPSALKGALVRISPPELMHAMIFAMHADFKNGADEPIMIAWRNAVLSLECEFRFVESEDAQHWACLQDRQDAQANYQGLKLSTLQMVYDVAEFKARKEKVCGRLSAAQVAELYATSVTWSAGQDCGFLALA